MIRRSSKDSASYGNDWGVKRALGAVEQFEGSCSWEGKGTSVWRDSGIREDILHGRCPLALRRGRGMEGGGAAVVSNASCRPLREQPVFVWGDGF